MLVTHVSHHFDLPAADGTLRDELRDLPCVAKRETWTRLYDSVAEDVSWLIRERYGVSLKERRLWGPDTD